MWGGVRKYLVGSVVLAALIGVAGCTHFFFAEREPWRHEAEVACLNSGVAQEIPGRVLISSIEGPGACGIDDPLKVSEIGESVPLSYDDAPPIPPSAIPEGAQPRWPVVQSSAPPPYGRAEPPPASYTPAPVSAAPYGQSHYVPPQDAAPLQGTEMAPQAGPPISLNPPGAVPADEDDLDVFGGPPHPYDGAPSRGAPSYDPQPQRHSPYEAQPAPAGGEPIPPLGPPTPPAATAGPVSLQPAAVLACPIVSALDKWVATGVQPAALKWFRQPVVEIKQIGGYSCRGMNGNPSAHISEHAFGNAMDIAEFDLADGHRISLVYAWWRGTPEEQGFLHDVQEAACRDFNTVLAPGANIYHYNHMHVDLMRRAYRSYVCEPAAIAGDIAAARARARYASQRGYGGISGTIRAKASSYAHRSVPDDFDFLPRAAD